jgi:hypothetical protein
MQLLINDLLSYSRHMQTVDHFELIDMNEILSDVISDLEIDIKKTNTGSTFIISLPERIWRIMRQICNCRK